MLQRKQKYDYINMTMKADSDTKPETLSRLKFWTMIVTPNLKS